MNIEGLWDETSGLSSLSEKTREPNHLQMSLQRQHFLLSYLKTLSAGPAGVELSTSRVTARCSTNWATVHDQISESVNGMPPVHHKEPPGYL